MSTRVYGVECVDYELWPLGGGGVVQPLKAIAVGESVSMESRTRVRLSDVFRMNQKKGHGYQATMSLVPEWASKVCAGPTSFLYAGSCYVYEAFKRQTEREEREEWVNRCFLQLKCAFESDLQWLAGAGWMTSDREVPLSYLYRAAFCCRRKYDARTVWRMLLSPEMPPMLFCDILQPTKPVQIVWKGVEHQLTIKASYGAGFYGVNVWGPLACDVATACIGEREGYAVEVHEDELGQTQHVNVSVEDWTIEAYRTLGLYWHISVEGLASTARSMAHSLVLDTRVGSRMDEVYAFIAWLEHESVCFTVPPVAAESVAEWLNHNALFNAWRKITLDNYALVATGVRSTQVPISTMREKRLRTDASIRSGYWMALSPFITTQSFAVMCTLMNVSGTVRVWSEKGSASVVDIDREDVCALEGLGACAMVPADEHANAHDALNGCALRALDPGQLCESAARLMAWAMRANRPRSAKWTIVAASLVTSALMNKRGVTPIYIIAMWKALMGDVSAKSAMRRWGHDLRWYQMPTLEVMVCLDGQKLSLNCLGVDWANADAGDMCDSAEMLTAHVDPCDFDGLQNGFDAYF